MLESDAGVFRPTGFGFTGSDAARAKVKEIATLLRGIQADRISAAGDGADIGPSVQAAGIPAMSLDVEGELLPDPPHPRRHDRQDRSDGHRARFGGDRGHDLRDCRDAGAAAVGTAAS